MPFSEALSRVFLHPAILPLIAIIFLLPFVCVRLILHRRKKAYLAIAHEPFTQLPLRPPSESLRLRIEELSEQFDTKTMGIAFAGFAAVAMVLTVPASQRLFIAAVLFVPVALVAFFLGRKVIALAETLWDYRLGFTGERVVGEELNQLLSQGFRVFHDVPFDGFNLDHVVVGPPGVYCIETKARRKPADLKGSDKAAVTFDGEKLIYPKGNWDTKALDQARRNARTLEKWLTDACGERIVAHAILTLPGWFVTRRAVSDVNVLNPQEIKNSFPDRPKHPLLPDQIQRLAHQLTTRCRLG